MKKYSSGSFVDAAVRVYGSEADTISSFPASIIADGQNASAVIYGNMQQSGTPTPASPIYPSECGDLVSSNYTLPIISGGVTTSIDLSAVQSTRRIKKLVLDGTENDWRKTSTNRMALLLTGNLPRRSIICVCSHYIGTAYSIANLSNGECSTGGSTDEFVILDENYTVLDDFKTFLQQQYSNGTPVIVWYVLAADTTGTLNEPLRKIGDYADSVAAAAIPTTAGSQTFNVDTTLKPSSVSLTYTGWHTHADKQYSGGSWGALTSGQVLRRKRTTKR